VVSVAERFEWLKLDPVGTYIVQKKASTGDRCNNNTHFTTMIHAQDRVGVLTRKARGRSISSVVAFPFSPHGFVSLWPSMPGRFVYSSGAPALVAAYERLSTLKSVLGGKVTCPVSINDGPLVLLPSSGMTDRSRSDFFINRVWTDHPWVTLVCANLFQARRTWTSRRHPSPFN